MAEQKALALINGKISEVPASDTIRGAGGDDFLSGTDLIPTGQTKIIPINKQSINFTQLTLDGTLTLDGDLWLA